MSDQVSGGGQPALPPSPYQIQVSYGAGQSVSKNGIARGTGADWFGPLDPLRPIAPPEVAGRRFDFPPGYNLVTRPRGYEPIGFAELRAFADAYDLLRLVIETRKDQMERQRWRIRPRAGKLNNSAAAVDADTQSRIAAVEHFFHKPDGITRWKTWLRSLLEDMFVIDAATLYCQRTRSGQLCALQQLDGSTIKRVIDDWGRTPLPYAGADGVTICPPAYQQVLKGLPAVDYSARDIIYRPRNVRAHRVYGFSPVQQILMTVNIALRRQMWQLDYYSEGSVPDALIGVPNSWTPEQIKQFQDYWDTEFSGDLARRRRAKFVPGDTAAKVVQTKEPEHKQDFDEWLARIICFAFSVPPQWAVKLMNRATADNQSAQAEEEGLEPTKEWVKELIDEIIAEEFSSPDLELHWLDEDADPRATEAALEGRVKLGALTLNEMRGALGLDPFDNAAADRPMVLTPAGYVPIEAGASPPSSSAGGAPRGANAAGIPLTRGSMRPRGPTDFPVERGNDVSLEKYSPDQPRVPAGNPDGGQWTSDDGSGGSNDSRVISDAASDNTWIPGAEYAGGIEDDDNESRSSGQPFEGTPAQQARDALALAQYRSMLAQLRRLDPTWTPSASAVDPNSIEGDIAQLRAATQEAEAHLTYLKSLGFLRDPETGHVVPPGAPKTGNPRIDATTDLLMGVLQKVVDEIGPRPDLSATQFGTEVHTRFAVEVRALNLSGIDTNDVERTFSVDDENSYYGAKDSIRPDVIVRDDDGNIVAIFDAKTGRGLDEPRVIRIRYMTDSDRSVPVIELHPSRGALSKCT